MKEKYRIGDGEQSELMSMRSDVPVNQQKSFNHSLRAGGAGAAHQYNPMGQDTRSLSKGSADQDNKATLECGGAQLSQSRAGAARQDGSTIDS